MLASKKTMKEFIKDDQGSWVMVFVVALMMLFTLMRVLGGEAPKGRGAQAPGELQTAGFVNSEPKKCNPVVAVSVDVEGRNEVLTALHNVITAFSEKPRC